MAITITRTIEETPAVYGASTGVAVKFGYGTLTNVLNKIGTADDGVIYFGYDEAKSTGAIVSRGKLVSSKILDITTTDAVTEEGGSVTKEAQIVISYIATDKTVKTLEIPVSADGKLKELTDKIDALKTLVGTKTDTKETDTVFGAIAKEADRATTKENAISDLLGTKDDDKTKETAFGKIKFEADRAVTAETGLSNRIKTLEDKKYTTVTPKTDGHVRVAVNANNVVTVTENDIASAQLLGTATDGSTANTAFGKIAAEADRATKAETGLSNRIKTLEDKKYTTVTPKTDGHVRVAVNANNVVTVTENDIASAQLLGTATDGSTANTAFGKIAAEADRATKAEGGLNTRVTSIETLITSDNNGTINKVSEVVNWFKGVEEGEGGAKLLADVAANKTAIGTKSVENSSTIYERIEGLEAKKHTVSNAVVETGKYVSGVHVNENGELTIDRGELTATNIKATAINAGDATVAVEGTNVSAQITSLAKSIKAASNAANAAIGALDVTDTAVTGQYVSAVSETDGKIKVTRANLPTLSVKAGSGQFAAVNNHEVEIKTTALNTVGLTKTSAGKWQAGTVDAKSTGLATAADVAAEIVSDEEVIATALNDHETRLKTVEGKEITVSSAKSDVAISVAEVKDGSNVVTTAATNFNVTNGKVTFTIHNGDKAVAETITAYTEDTVKALVELYAKEKARAEAAEAELNKKLTWIDV